jgi:AraC family transcriptional regulator
MMHRLLPLLKEIHAGRGGSLAALARRAGWSRFHFHRVFREHLRETPRQHTERVRLTHAAGQLLLTARSVLTIALEAGYASHEVFTRAFRRCFGCAPEQYRRTALAEASQDLRRRHVTWSLAAGRCIRLYHCASRPPSRSPVMPTPSITRQERTEQPILLIERRIARSELAAMLAECFGTLFNHGMRSGLPIAGAPLARFVDTSPGLWTVQAAMPLAAPAAAAGEMQPGALPGGPVAVAVHAGPYETLSDTYAAMERWIEAQGLKVAGRPWESYITDPAQHPDPQDWRTEVCWPLMS